MTNLYEDVSSAHIMIQSQLDTPDKTRHKSLFNALTGGKQSETMFVIMSKDVPPVPGPNQTIRNALLL